MNIHEKSMCLWYWKRKSLLWVPTTHSSILRLRLIYYTNTASSFSRSLENTQSNLNCTLFYFSLFYLFSIIVNLCTVATLVLSSSVLLFSIFYTNPIYMCVLTVRTFSIKATKGFLALSSQHYTRQTMCWDCA